MINNIKFGEISEEEATTICERVKAVRKRPGIGLTQEAFAAEIGVSTNTISRIERGEISFSSDVALRIAKRWDVSLDYLFGRSPCMANEMADAELTSAQTLIDIQAATIKELSEKIGAIQRIIEGKKPIIKLEKPYCSI